LTRKPIARTGFRVNPWDRVGLRGRAELEPTPEPDYRFTLANERTFLAYVRTALGLDAAGLAASQLLQPSASHLRLLIAMLLVALGAAVVLLGYRRWAGAEAAIRRGAPLPPVRLPLALVCGILAVSVGAVVLIVMNR
jgi:putative membrane protein